MNNPYVSRVPASHPVRPIKSSNPAPGRMTCGHCHLSWDDSIVTGMTPTPAARCPFECFHKYGPNIGDTRESQRAGRLL